MTEISRRTFGRTMAAGFGTSMLAAPATRPNIVFICSDQHSGRLLGLNGHPVVRTPTLDRLASIGVHFRNTYCGNPVCVPSRASFMSGMYASDVGSYCNSTPFDGRVPSWGNRLRKVGYYCWATGKMDLEQGVDYGFKEVATSHGHSHDPDITALFRAPVCFRPGGRQIADGQFEDREHGDAELVRRALRFLREEAVALSEPWAMYVGLRMPHPRWIAQRKYRDLYPPEKMPLPVIPKGYLEGRHTAFQVFANYNNVSTPVPEERIRRARAAYFGMVTELDGLIGRLVEELEKTKQLDNTLVVYTSDHGEMLGEHGLWSKNVLLENAARVPLILAGAGLPRGKAVDTPVSHVDLVATLLDVAAASVPNDLRGRSLVPLATGEPGDHPGYAFSEAHSEGNCTGSFMIRKGDWKYIYLTGDRNLLFDVRTDPSEFRSRAGDPDFADVEQELHTQLTALLDPDAVTRQAFAEQERRLKAMVQRLDAGEFYEAIVGRMGPAQARIQTYKYYGKKT